MQVTEELKATALQSWGILTLPILIRMSECRWLKCDGIQNIHSRWPFVETISKDMRMGE